MQYNFLPHLLYNCASLPHMQEATRWQGFMKWNNATRVFGDDDVLGFGDTDEIPSLENLNLLKHCKLIFPSVDIGTYFSFGNNKQV